MIADRRREFAERAGTAIDPRRGYDSTAVADVPPSMPASPIGLAMLGELSNRWAAADGKYWQSPHTIDRLGSGFYDCAFSPDIGPFLIRKTVLTDGLIELPEPTVAAVIAEFDRFWATGDLFRQHGFIRKRGFLLWGPPGSGKTSTLNLMMQNLIKTKDGVVVFGDQAAIAQKCLAMLRRIEAERPMIVVLEDLDAIVERHGERDLLALLDGDSTIDNVVFVATTNYPERLDKRFVDRPSRFDTISYFGMPGADARAAYLKAKDATLADDPAELSRWVEKSEGFSVAHIREMIIAVRCLGQSVEEVVERLEIMHHRQPSSDDVRDVKAGFLRPNGAAGRLSSERRL